MTAPSKRTPRPICAGSDAKATIKAASGLCRVCRCRVPIQKGKLVRHYEPHRPTGRVRV